MKIFFEFFASLLGLALVAYELRRRSLRISGFQGPPGLPIIGNIARIRWNASEQYRRWALKYSSVYQVQLGHIPVIVINSAAAAKSILGENSQAMGSRPVFPTFHQVVSKTVGTTIGTSPYDESFKRRRKAAASGAVDPLPMIQRLSLSLSLTMNWGTPKLDLSSELFREVSSVQNQVSRLRSTTGNLQDYVPLLRLNPFGQRIRMAEALKARRDAFLKSLNEDLNERMDRGIHQSCIRSSIISDRDVELREAEMTSVSLTMLSAGLNTQSPPSFAGVLPCWQRGPIFRTLYSDPTVYGDPEVFRPERWLQNPRLPLFTYGIGYRMCAGFLLANRELYLIFMRLISSFEIHKEGEIDAHPVRGATDPSNLATMPKRYMVRFVPRNKGSLVKALEAL